jgi:hypothetical protein
MTMSRSVNARRPPPWSPWRPNHGAAGAEVTLTPRPAAVAAIKAFPLAWLSIESCVVFVLSACFAGRTDKRVGMAAATGSDVC